MDREELAHLLVGTAVAVQIKANVDEGRKAVLTDLVTGDRVGGQAAGLHLGSVSKCAGRTTAKVTDERALLKYVETNHPEEIILAVRPAFREKLLKESAEAGVGVDAVTGARLDFIEVAPGDPYLQVRPSDDLKATVSQKLTALVAGGLLELES